MRESVQGSGFRVWGLEFEGRTSLSLDSFKFAELPNACKVQGLRLRVDGLGLRESVQGSGFRVWGSGFGGRTSLSLDSLTPMRFSTTLDVIYLGAQGSGFRVQGAGFRVQGAKLGVWGSGFRVQGSGFRVQGPGFRV